MEQSSKIERAGEVILILGLNERIDKLAVIQCSFFMIMC